jgi:hypothetical protein
VVLMRIIYEPNALKATTERLFPYSRHRSKRIHKKLMRRFGGEFRMTPCIFRYGDKFIAHTSMRAEIERATGGTILERRLGGPAGWQS